MKISVRGFEHDKTAAAGVKVFDNDTIESFENEDGFMVFRDNNDDVVYAFPCEKIIFIDNVQDKNSEEK